MTDLTLLSAGEMAEGIRSGQISAVALMQAHLEKIVRLNPVLNAFVQIDSDRAMRAAYTAQDTVKPGKPLGPLHGVPISIKSSIEVEGLRCEAGTRLRAGY